MRDIETRPRLFGPPDAGLTEAADRMIGFFKLSHLADEKAGGLSYGQQKLLDAAMAFMAGPRLVLLDEPAGGVNLTMLASLKERLQAINAEQGATRFYLQILDLSDLDHLDLIASQVKPQLG